MNRLDAITRVSGQSIGAAMPSWHSATAAWSFIYIFFTNGIPFDSPNRSEPCQLS